MTIFKRDCPECAAANPPDALLCACGYCFDPDRLARTDPQAYARQQERLYLEYLKARLVQARADAQAAREAAGAEPGDQTKAMGLRAAEAALAALRTELAEHARRVPAALSQATVRAPAGGVAGTRARPAAVRAPASARPADVTNRPSENFRHAQAQRANALVRAARGAARPPRVAPAPVSPAPALASASTAGRGATQTCPNCTATVSAEAERCRCGYGFARPGEAVPALALDAGALAILADGIRFTGPVRRR